MKKTPTHLVVDGSNIATEGRQLPSLTQLEEAVDAFVTEQPFDNVIVVVDATFGHRITPKERRWFDELVATNRIITPPAGAIGRGDAFILQIATRANATVLSNDSFQEFHGVHHWLFDEGRLIGGKPVPHVGWVFVSRTPVRGPASRRAVKKTKPSIDTDTNAVNVDDARDAIDAPHAMEPTTRAPQKTREEKTRDDKTRVDKDRDDIARPVVVGVAMSVATPTNDDASDDRDAHGEPTRKSSKRRSRRGRKPSGEASTTPTSTVDTVFDRRFNETLVFQGFRDAHPVGTVVEVVVDRFSSHGAYARVAGVEVYVPTKSLGDPPPPRARDVLTLGEATLVAIDRYDDDACGIDVRAIRNDERDTYYDSLRASSSLLSSIDASDDNTTQGSEQPTRRSEPVATKKAAAKKAPAKKAPAKKAVAKKAPAKKAVAKKAPAKKAVAKKAPAKKAVAKKAPAKKAAAKKAPAKRTARK